MTKLFLVNELARLGQALLRLIRPSRGQPSVWIEAEVLKHRLDDDEHVTVVDVRGPEEFTGPLGHIPDSLNIPIDNLRERINELEPLAEQPIVLVCKTDKRSANAAQLLRNSGFRRVPVLRGGLERWNELGFDTRHSVETEASATSA